MRNPRLARILPLTVLLVVAGSSLAVAANRVQERYMVTGGDTRGVALRDYHAFLADGPAGLKIANLSYPYGVGITGLLAIPDSRVDDVAVDRDTVVLTDSTHGRVHFVDVSDLMRPALLSTLQPQGDTPHQVVAAGGKAYVLEFGRNPSSLDYFSGVETFSYVGRVESRQLRAIEGARSLAVHRGHVFVGAGNQILAYGQTASGLGAAPVARVHLPRGEVVHSLAAWDGYLFAFGQEELFVVGFVPIPLVLPGPGDPPRPPTPPKPRPALDLSILARLEVDCELENRNVTARVLDYGGDTSSEPNVAVLLTTIHSYALVAFDKTTQTLSAVPFRGFFGDPGTLFRNVHDETDGMISIYDARLPVYTRPGWLIGGIMGVGALGEHGLGFAYLGPE